MKIGLAIDVFAAPRCNEMKREAAAKHLNSPGHCGRAGSSPAVGTTFKKLFLFVFIARVVDKTGRPARHNPRWYLINQ
jgi:hypothetical protein